MLLECSSVNLFWTWLQGISSYLWQLTAEDHLDHAMLINPTLPVLHVLDLTPGNYTFTLLVTDESGQMSTDTVDVCVLAG